VVAGPSKGGTVREKKKKLPRWGRLVPARGLVSEDSNCHKEGGGGGSREAKHHVTFLTGNTQGMQGSKVGKELGFLTMPAAGKGGGGKKEKKKKTCAGAGGPLQPVKK